MNHHPYPARTGSEQSLEIAVHNLISKRFLLLKIILQTFCFFCFSFHLPRYLSHHVKELRIAPGGYEPVMDKKTIEKTSIYRRKSKKVESNSKKEVFQPHLPVRLPCYDLAPVTGLALGRSSRSRTSGAPGSHGLTGGVYKARERIHRAMADARLLANPASRSRVADSDPN